MPPPKRRPATTRRTTAKRRPAATRRKARPRRRPLSPWLLLGGGLVVGIVGTLAFNAMRDGKWAALWDNVLPTDTGPLEPLPTPRFDFYAVLPNQEVMVPDTSPPEKKAGKPESGQPPPLSKGAYYLQVGSFRAHDEANSMRARVILLGAQASIQSVTLNKDTWHRVRVGPYQNPERLREVRQRLRTHKIETLLIRAQR